MSEFHLPTQDTVKAANQKGEEVTVALVERLAAMNRALEGRIQALENRINKDCQNGSKFQRVTV